MQTATRTRQEIAASFRERAEQNLTAAQLCLDMPTYGNACSLAWMSIYQAVVACVYQKLKHNPRNPERGFEEAQAEKFFAELLKVNGPKHPHRPLLDSLVLARRYRMIADYEVRNNEAITPYAARRSMETAREVHELLWKMLPSTTASN